MMLQLDLPTRVALAPLVQDPFLRRALSLAPEELTVVLQEWEQRLMRQGLSAAAAQAYLTVAPLLMEHEALSTYCRTTGNWELRRMLPEVLTAGEAAAVAAREFNLEPVEELDLERRLERLEQPTSATL